MFQNANVLYKVHFAEGESKVDRQVLKKKKWLLYQIYFSYINNTNFIILLIFKIL